MKAELLKIECLTNLHVGSGDVNFNVIDNEVEKDPATLYPTIHASGVKGAFRSAYCGKEENKIFGCVGSVDKSDSAGAYKFFDAKFLSRPLRVGGNSKKAYVPVTSIQAINDFLELTSNFGCNNFGIEKVDDFFKDKNCEFLVSCDGIENIEGIINVKKLKVDPKTEDSLKKILGNDFAIAKDINNYDLPVVARNFLESGISKNLWYEEFVPHHSVFGLVVLIPDGEKFNLDISKPIQFGGNASVGYGYCKVTEFGKEMTK